MASYFLLILAILFLKFQFLKNFNELEVKQKMESLANEYSSSIGNSIVSKNEKNLINIVEEINNFSFLSGSKLTNALKKDIVKKGQIYLNDFRIIFPINIEKNYLKERVAYLHLYGNRELLNLKIKNQFYISCIKLFSEFFLIGFFIFFFFKFFLKRSLQEMLNKINSIKPEDLKEISLEDSHFKELYSLKKSFNKMILKISQDKKTFEERNETLKKMDHQKTNFFKNISIELQTPLSLIIEPLENLHQKFIDEKHFSTALKSSKKLYRLVEQILDFQTLSVDKITQKDWPINVFHFLKQTHFLFQSSYALEDIDFSLEIENLLPESSQEDLSNHGVFIRVNPENFEKIIFNFLSNALKFTGEGGKITLGGERRGTNIRIFVKDTGPGIPKDKQNDVFELFKQLEPDPTITYEGSGLGLALAKELCIKMKGNIGLESDVGHGCEFYCEFEEIDYQKEELDILILEDEIDTANTLEVILEKLSEMPKYKVALDSKQGRKILDEYQVKLIIADSRLPGEGGISFLNFAGETQPQTKKILLTGDTDYEMLKDAHNYAKVDAIIFKPWDEHFLLKNIEELLECFGPSLKKSFYLNSNEELKKDTEDILDQDPVDKDRKEGSRLILVVDDLREMRELISKELINKGLKVITRNNGLQGYEAAKQFKPDLIVSDWMMPLMNGPQMIVKLKKDPDLQKIPVLILTSRADNESRIRGIDIGADNYLSKPFKFQELLSNIFNLIELKENEKKLNNANKDLKEKQSAIQNLLENLGQGFLIFDEKGVVQPGCSEVTKEFFGVDPTHKFFYDVISLSDERKNTFTRWIKNLWKGNFSFKDMLPLAPKFYEEENKYIHLNYKPIYKEGKKVEKVICVATDKTQERNLENKTKEEKEKVQMILKILKDPISFQNILDTAYASLNMFETELKKDPQDIDITYLFRKIHTLKALFASFSIPKIPFEMNTFENYLSEVREQKKLLSFKIVKEIDRKIKNIYSLITSFTKKNRIFLEQSTVKVNLGKKTISNEDILEISQMIESTLGSEHHLYKNYVDEFVLETISVNFFKMSERFEKLAEKKNKPLKFHIKTTHLKIRQDHYISFFETMAHLFNFLINYDLETFQEREILGKEKTGIFDISFLKEGSDHVKILITSDGKGLDEAKIDEYTKVKGLSSPPRDLLKIFKSDDLYNILGTNISQDIQGIHNFIEEIEKLEGTLKVESYPQKGFSFEVTLPFYQKTTLGN